MKVALGNDHAGFDLKEYLKPRLVEAGVEVVDCGCYSRDPVDWAEYTLKVVWELVSGNCDRGIYTCGNGYAMAMLANRVPGIRATICHDSFTARSTKEMGDSNVISLGARVIGPELAWDLVQIWLKTEFLGKNMPRYARRLEQLAEFDKLFARPDWKQRLEEYVKRTGHEERCYDHCCEDKARAGGGSH